MTVTGFNYSKKARSKLPCHSNLLIDPPLEPGNFPKRVLYPVMDELGIKREDRKPGFHLFRHSVATILHEETGDIEVAQRALGHARRSTTEDIYDHVEQVIDEKVTGLLLDAIAPDLSILSSDAIN